MPFNYLGDLYKSEIVNELNKRGYEIKNVHSLNLIMEEMGLLVHNGNTWMTTELGVPYTIYNCSCNADAWHPSVIDAICDYLS